MGSRGSVIVNLLTRAGANTNLADSTGLTPLISGKQKKTEIEDIFKKSCIKVSYIVIMLIF